MFEDSGLRTRPVNPGAGTRSVDPNFDNYQSHSAKTSKAGSSRWTTPKFLLSALVVTVLGVLLLCKFVVWSPSQLIPVYTPSLLEDWPDERNQQLKQTATITVAIATQYKRRAGLEKVIQALLPQVDVIHIYANDYDEIPTWLQHAKIHVNKGTRDLLDTGKLFFIAPGLNVNYGYYFTCDDDINYPPDYVARMTQAVDKYQRKAVVGVHGGVLLSNIKLAGFFSGGREIYHFASALAQDQLLHVIGSGTMVFHTDLLQMPEASRIAMKEPEAIGAGRIGSASSKAARQNRGTNLSFLDRTHLSSLPLHGGVDIHFAIHAAKQGIPLVAVARNDNWLSQIQLGKSLEDDTLWNHYRTKDSQVTNILLSGYDWSFPVDDDDDSKVADQKNIKGISYFARGYRQDRNENDNAVVALKFDAFPVLQQIMVNNIHHYCKERLKGDLFPIPMQEIALPCGLA